MQSIDNVLKLRKGLKPDDPNPDIFDVLWAKKLSNVARDYTVTGNPLSFLAKKAQTAKSTKVTLEPVQDLHGYKNPWPAGDGKNRFDKNSPNILTNQRIAVSTGATYDSNGYSVSDYIPIELAERFSLTISSGFTSYYAGYDANKQYIQTPTNTWNSGSSKILSAEGYAYVRFDFKTSDINSVQFEKGYASAYAPYSNICPISGRSSVEIKGRGKNQFNKNDDSEILDKMYINTEQNKVLNGSSTKSVIVPCKPNTTYTVSKTAGKRFTVATSRVYPYNGSAVNGVITDPTGTAITITTNSNAAYLIAYVYSSSSSTGETKTWEEIVGSVQIEEGFSATEYESYQQSNDVTIIFPAVGKNLFDKDTCVFIPTEYISATGEIESNGSYSYCETYIPVKPSTDYIFSGNVVSSSTTNSVAFYDDDKSFISRFQPSRGENAQFTTPENTRYIRFNVGKASYNVNTIQIEEGSQASSYEPYTNTVYGGTLDVETGEVTVNMAMVDLGNKTYVRQTIPSQYPTAGYRYRASLSNSLANKSICSHLPRVSSTYNSYGFNISENYVFIADKYASDNTMTANEFVNYVNGWQLIYAIATPRTIQLTPEQINILKGQNNIWIEDEGATIALTYKN